MTSADQDAPATGSAVLRMLLGAHLRRLREARGITRATAGWEIRSSESKISRMELGRVSFKERDVVDLLTLYGVDDESERQRMLELARQANVPGWWHRFNDVLPNWFQPYLGLEASAQLIRSYEIQFVPGLLQTSDYARAVMMLGHTDTTDPQDVDRRLDLRMQRQQLLAQPRPPQLWAVIDEAVLRRPIGGVGVLRAQIEALIVATDQPNIRLQVVGFRVGGHAAAGGAFSILRFPDQDLPDVVYTEQLTSALYLDKRDDVEQYATAMEQLCIAADPPHRTADILQHALKQLDDAT